MMKSLVLFSFLFLPLFPLSQITISQEDMEEIYTIGDTAFVYSVGIPSLLDVGHPGGDNIWEGEEWNLWGFSSSPNHLEYILYPDSAFMPQSNFRIRASWELASAISYHQLDTSLRTTAVQWWIGGSGPSTDYFNPFKFEYKLPIEYLESWEGFFEQLNGDSTIVGSMNVVYEVDAYGSMTSPFDEVFDALRIKESYYEDSVLTQVIFKLLSDNGAMYELIKENVNDPDSGFIYLEYVSYRTPFFSGNPNSIEKFQNSFKLSCSPNPITSNSSINLTLKKACQVQISLHSIMGEKIAEISDMQMPQGSNFINFNPREYDLSPGVYLLSVSACLDSESLKIIVQ